MMGDIVLHEDVRINDGEGRTDKDTEEIFACETFVLPSGVGRFPFSHTCIAFEDDAGVHGNDDAVVTEFAEETSVAVVDGSRYGTEVIDVVVEGVTVDMVDCETGRDLSFEGEVLKAGEVHITVFSAKS